MGIPPWGSKEPTAAEGSGLAWPERPCEVGDVSLSLSLSAASGYNAVYVDIMLSKSVMH